MNKINLTSAAILTMAISYVIAGIFWRVVAPNPAFLTAPNPQPPQANLRIANNIFGNKKNQKKPPIKSQKIKLSPLNFKLVGILLREPHNSFAIISPLNTNAAAKVYQKGDNLTTDAVIEQIKATSVILKRGEKTEELRLQKPEKNPVISNKNRQNTGKRIIQKAKLSTIQRSTLNDYRVEIVSNPSKLLSLVSVLPFFRDGKMVGVKVKPNKNKAIFNDLGFKSGDIIVEINNIRIDNFNKFAKLRQLIYSQSAFDLKIQRNNKNIYLFIQL